MGNDPTTANRDVFFIQAKYPDDDVMVYRNEDTGWGWPPYFKFDTSNLQAEAADLKSTADAPRWAVALRWRSAVITGSPVVLQPLACRRSTWACCRVPGARNACRG